MGCPPRIVCCSCSSEGACPTLYAPCHHFVQGHGFMPYYGHASCCSQHSWYSCCCFLSVFHVTLLLSIFVMREIKREQEERTKKEAEMSSNFGRHNDDDKRQAISIWMRK